MMRTLFIALYSADGRHQATSLWKSVMRIPYGAPKVKQKNGGLLPGGSRPPFLMQAADENVGVGYQKVTGAHKSAYLCGIGMPHTIGTDRREAAE